MMKNTSKIQKAGEVSVCVLIIFNNVSNQFMTSLICFIHCAQIHPVIFFFMVGQRSQGLKHRHVLIKIPISGTSASYSVLLKEMLQCTLVFWPTDIGQKLGKQMNP